MKEPVDKLLTGRIRQVFEDFEDPSADAGWKALRKRYPERDRRPLILWLSSAAALLILAAGLWFTQKPEQHAAFKPVEKGKTKEKTKERTKVSMPGSSEIAKETVIARGATGSAEAKRSVLSDRDSVVSGNNRAPGISGTDKIVTAAAKKEETPAVSEILPDQVTGTAHTGESRAEQALAIVSPPLPGISEPEGTRIKAVVAKLPVMEVPAIKMEAVKPRQEKLPEVSQLPLKEPVTAAVPNEQIEKPVIAREFNPRPVEKMAKSEPAIAKKPKTGFSVYAGSYFNYSEGSENQLNFGAGIISDIRLSKNLKLSTGVSIASNSLNYSGGRDLPENAAASFHSMATSKPGNLTTITSYHADLLALDIPVNLKYQFIPESDKLYVSAGLSSGTYLNETYAYQYRNFNTASGNYINQTEDQKIKKQFNDFDLGRTLNLSLGLSTGFGKTQTISIEPFLKYPLGGLGSENLRFGSTGINLKLRFNP